MQMKQTAVEWLANEMPVIDWQVPYWKIKLEKAKEMEKEQIIDAANFDSRSISENGYRKGEQYYNETYNKQ
jgi:hypothetical protein